MIAISSGAFAPLPLKPLRRASRHCARNSASSSRRREGKSSANTLAADAASARRLRASMIGAGGASSDISIFKALANGSLSKARAASRGEQFLYPPRAKTASGFERKAPRFGWRRQAIPLPPRTPRAWSRDAGRWRLPPPFPERFRPAARLVTSSAQDRLPPLRAVQASHIPADAVRRFWPVSRRRVLTPSRRMPPREDLAARRPRHRPADTSPAEADRREG